MKSHRRPRAGILLLSIGGILILGTLQGVRAAECGVSGAGQSCGLNCSGAQTFQIDLEGGNAGIVMSCSGTGPGGPVTFSASCATPAGADPLLLLGSLLAGENPFACSESGPFPGANAFVTCSCQADGSLVLRGSCRCS